MSSPTITFFLAVAMWDQPTSRATGETHPRAVAGLPRNPDDVRRNPRSNGGVDGVSKPVQQPSRLSFLLNAADYNLHWIDQHASAF